MPRLGLVRHGRTPYNEAGIWTGLTDIDVSEDGNRQATRAGMILLQERFEPDAAYISELRRTRSTLEGILRILGTANPVPVTTTAALNERNYGIYTGKSKKAVKNQVGEEMFALIRRSWDHPIENGETLKDVHDRVASFHYDVIKPQLIGGKTLLAISSNNTLRAYVKELEGISDDDVASIELGTAEVRIYDFDNFGTVIDRTVYPVGDVH